MGEFCAIASGRWEARSFNFVAPSDVGDKVYIVFAAAEGSSGTAYPGIDLVSLTDLAPCP